MAEVITPTAQRQFLLDSFILGLRAENASQRTIDTYQEAVTQFIRYLSVHGMPTDPHKVTREYIEAFIAELLTLWKPATANNRYRGLQRYFKWLQDEGEVKVSPMAHMHPPRIPYNPHEVLSDEEIAGILRKCAGTDFTSHRDMAILRILLDSGLRRAELAGLTMSDVDLRNQRLRVLGKGSRVREVPVGRKTAQALDRYIRIRSSHRLASEPNLWLGKLGAMTPSGIYQVVVDRAREAGLTAHTHQLRHTFCHLWLRNDGNESDLMQLAGWRSRSMLNRYAASRAAERAQEAHKKHSPGDLF